uniref:Integral membrane protein 2 n=1 Tax=Hippocampus comes TaxID=109280 RepID=A0A3Q3DT20_HIPCM
MIAVLVILLGLLLGSIYTYRHFHPSKESADEFKCHVVFEDRNSQVELTMDVAISLEKNYEYITVVKMGRRDHPFDIIHDFEHSKTAYYDKQLSKCFVGPLNTVVLYPHNLREMLSNTEVRPRQMATTPRMQDREMSPTIQEMCRGRETYEMQRGDPGECQTPSGLHESATFFFLPSK